MTKTEIKHNIHSLIDTVEDEESLEQIQEIVQAFAEDKNLTWNSLAAEERKSIETGLAQLNNGEKIDYEDIKKKYPEWFTK